MLASAFNLDQGLSGHIDALQLQELNQIHLFYVIFLPYHPDIGPNGNVLLDFLFVHAHLQQQNQFGSIV